MKNTLFKVGLWTKHNRRKSWLANKGITIEGFLLIMLCEFESWLGNKGITIEGFLPIMLCEFESWLGNKGITIEGFLPIMLREFVWERCFSGK